MPCELHTALWLTCRAFGGSINKICLAAIGDRIRQLMEGNEASAFFARDLREAATAAGLFAEVEEESVEDGAASCV
jgi:hypothetical protein